MKTLKFLPIFAFSIFLLSSVSATIVSGGLWANNQQANVTITNGQSANFNAYFGTIPYNSMTVNIKLYDSKYNLLNSFENNKAVNSNTFSNSYTVTSSMYKNPGTYSVILMGTDAAGSNSYTLTLFVNPSPPPVNQTPVINSIPNQTVNESSAYSYQVVASDPDGDSISYSLSGVSWLTINQSGFISGVAPNVTSDTPYNLTVQVSDGAHTATQNYVLTVLNVPVQNDTVPPLVSLVSPINNFLSNSSIVGFIANATDNVALSNLTLYIWNATGLVYTNTSGQLSGTSNSSSWNFLAPDGNFIWNVLGKDAAGNSNWSQVNQTFTVDTTAPQIQFTASTPSNNSVLNSTIISVNLTALDLLSGLSNMNIYLYNATGLLNNISGSSSPLQFNFINLIPGIYYLNATASDIAGNTNSTQTFTITLQSSNNQTNQTNNTNPIVIPANNPYNYNDVYATQPITQPSNNNTITSPQENLGATSQTQSPYTPILIVEGIFVVCALITVFVIAIKKLK